MAARHAELGRPVHDRPGCATEFYQSVFGWEIHLTGGQTGQYSNCLLEGRPVAGLGSLPPGDPEPGWTTHLAVEDADQAVSAIVANGGTIVTAPTQIADEGRFAVAQDPTGAFFGLWQAGSHIGAQVVNQPGAMVWNECLSSEPERARRFYAAVFGYTYTPIDGAGDYTTIDGDGPGGTVGGIGQLPASAPAQVPSHWRTYFEVADADEAADRTSAAGGTVVVRPSDTPFGRIAVLRDPQGAVFSVLQATGAADAAAQG